MCVCVTVCVNVYFQVTIHTWPFVSISYGINSCDKLPQIQWIQTTQMCYFSDLEGRRTKTRVSVRLCALWGSKGGYVSLTFLTPKGILYALAHDYFLIFKGS